jgi:pimeloyl-[acyl-carrier protein] synthase
VTSDLPSASTTVVDPSPPSLYQLLDPDVLADPYPLYRKLRDWDPVCWDPFLHAWVVTSYADVATVLQKFSADRTPTPDQLKAMGLGALESVAQVMVRQMLFMDAPAHTRLRGLCSSAFTSRRVELLRSHIQDITDELLDRVQPLGRMDVIADFANPLPAIVTAELLGVPTSDHQQLKAWSADFAEMLGNFQHNPDRADRVLRSVAEMTAYFRAAVREQARLPHGGLIHHLMTASVAGTQLSEDEVIANTIVTMVGGQEATTNLIGNGLLTLLRHPTKLTRLRDDPSIIEPAVEELLRYESPSQHTARLAPDDVMLGGKPIRKRDAVMAVMAAGNRDPQRFPDPDRLDLTRPNNRHLAFGWAAHFCFGAPLARMEGQIAFATLLRRLPDLALEPGPLVWRQNLGLRGLTSLKVSFQASSGARHSRASRHDRSA